jgi:hypothetical protein
MGNRASTTPRRAAPPPPADDAEAAMLRAGLAAFTVLAGSDCDVSLFFVVAPGTDGAEFAQRFAARGALRLAEPAPEYAETAASLLAVERSTVASRWTRPTAAIEWFMARQAGHTLLCLPRRGAPLEPPAVSVYTRSPVEDLHVALPALLDNKLDDTMLTVLRFSADAAWHVLLARCPAPTALWIYARIADDDWRVLCDSHRTHSGVSDATIDQWNTWRRRTDEFFYRSSFARSFHTLVITVHGTLLTNNAVVADSAVIIARHIAYATAAGAWGPAVPTATMNAFVATPDYQRARHATAAQLLAPHAATPRTIAGEMQLDFAPPPPPPPAARRADPFAALPAVHPHDDF